MLVCGAPREWPDRWAAIIKPNKKKKILMTPAEMGEMFPQHSFVINILRFIKIMMGT